GARLRGLEGPRRARPGDDHRLLQRPRGTGEALMAFVETPAQRERREAAQEIVRTVIAPAAAKLGPQEKLSAEDLRVVFRALAPLGYLGSTIPREFGGAGLSYVDYGLLLETLAAGPVVLGEIVPPRTINYLGNDEQRQRWLPSLFSGDW